MAKATKKVETKEAPKQVKQAVVNLDTKQTIALKLGQIRAKRINK